MEVDDTDAAYLAREPTRRRPALTSPMAKALALWRAECPAAAPEGTFSEGLIYLTSQKGASEQGTPYGMAGRERCMTIPAVTSGIAPVVGHYYLVPCYQWASGKRWFPIHGLLHADPDIGVSPKHYHLDVRFMSRRQIHSWVAYPRSDHPREAEAMTRVISAMTDPPWTISYRRVLCKRAMPEFPPMPWQGKIGQPFESHCLDLDNPVCPHKGFALKSLPQRAGVVTCPGHGLR